jgi:hypothetical protein
VKCRTGPSRSLPASAVPELNEIIIGVMGRAQRLFDFQIFAFQFLSDIITCLLGPWTHAARRVHGILRRKSREAGRASVWSRDSGAVDIIARW